MAIEQLDLIQLELRLAVYQTNKELRIKRMNMRLRELAASIGNSSDHGRVPADIAAPIPVSHQPAPSVVEQASTPLPSVAFVPAATRQTTGGKMSTLAELKNKVIAAKQARQKTVNDLMSQHDALEQEANDALAEVKADLDDTKQEIEELKNSLNPTLGDNGGPTV